MSRYSGYNSREDVHMEILQDAESQQQQDSRRLDHHSMTGGRKAEHGMVPQHSMSSKGSAQYQFNPQNNRILTQPSVSRTLSRHQHWPVPSLQDVINGLPSRNMGDLFSPGEGTPHIPLLCHAANQESEEHHVAQIVSEMEKDVTLMGDNPLSEQLRMETLREMPESLTIKRTIKRKLVKSVSQKSKHTPLSVWKRLKYRLSISLEKFSVAIRNLLYILELWYSSLKTIEGHFGSGVATYFRFLRLLFLLNTVVFVISFGFIVIPQLLYRLHKPVEASQNDTGSSLYDMASVFFTPSDLDSVFRLYEENNSTRHIVTPVPVTTQNWKLPPSGKYRPQVKSNAYTPNADFSIGNIFTGEGFFTDTALYYGHYTNESVNLVLGQTYSIPAAYFFTVLACYLVMFVVLSVSMARSYRRTFIENEGDIKSMFAQKVFCAWDFSTATNEAAALKSKSIYNELKELLGDIKKEVAELSWQGKCFLLAVRISLNIFIALVLASTGFIIWFLLREETRVTDTATANHGATMIMPVIITVIMIVAPVLFSWMARLEDYSNPRTALFVTLTRTFLMEMVVIGVVVAFWLTFKKNSECWETSLGQEVYRLVITDFLLAVVGTSLAEFVRFQIYKLMWKKIGGPEFDIARNTLNIIYNQTLFFVGLYFSPLLAFIVVLKMFITFYVKKLGLLNNCQPSARPWRAAQTHTLFLVLSFVAALVVLILLGYIFTHVGVYYLRAKSHAHKSMVHLLREMLVLEAKDKEFLLHSISKVTEGQWLAHLRTEKKTAGHSNLREQVSHNTSSGDSTAGGTSVCPSDYSLSEYERPRFQRDVRERRH
ncbi:transmembrane channel-like protein 5 isoform X2 [Cryptotermes secundus]|uniref:transmembrane channel-like protein 5 isoform X2 n=1 Tax=Cryptotermes secundus TaxID=105785 RepID=UPI001454C578|nr:transmembrane channel-like protein 5 isoform X2 [Cryptotermes secundus]